MSLLGGWVVSFEKAFSMKECCDLHLEDLLDFYENTFWPSMRRPFEPLRSDQNFNSTLKRREGQYIYIYFFWDEINKPLKIWNVKYKFFRLEIGAKTFKKPKTRKYCYMGALLKLRQMYSIIDTTPSWNNIYTGINFQSSIIFSAISITISTDWPANRNTNMAKST